MGPCSVHSSSCPWLTACMACQVATAPPFLSLSPFAHTDVHSPQLIHSFAPTEGENPEPTAQLQAQRREARTHSSALLSLSRAPPGAEHRVWSRLPSLEGA